MHARTPRLEVVELEVMSRAETRPGFISQHWSPWMCEPLPKKIFEQPPKFRIDAFSSTDGTIPAGSKVLSVVDWYPYPYRNRQTGVMVSPRTAEAYGAIRLMHGPFKFDVILSCTERGPQWPALISVDKATDRPIQEACSSLRPHLRKDAHMAMVPFGSRESLIAEIHYDTIMGDTIYTVSFTIKPTAS